MNVTALTGGSTRNTAPRQAAKCAPSSVASQARCRQRRPGAGGGGCQCAPCDVRIGALGVGVGVMPVVLAGPPAVADPGAEVSARHAEDGVGPPGAEDLTVPGIVAEEAELGENH